MCLQQIAHLLTILVNFTRTLSTVIENLTVIRVSDYSSTINITKRKWTEWYLNQTAKLPLKLDKKLVVVEWLVIIVCENICCTFTVHAYFYKIRRLEIVYIIYSIKSIEAK